MNSINKVYIVYKHSLYQKYILNEKNEHLMTLLKAKHPTTRDMLATHNAHLKTIEEVKESLREFGIKYKISGRSHLKSFNGYDLIITIGGDGTLLRSSLYVKDQFIIGINSDPKHSVGALCSINANEFKSKMEKILAGNFDVKEMLRMQIKLNKDKIPLEPINDVLFTNNSPAATSRYLISKNSTKEEHKSSGIWIATPSGSTAAIHAAGGVTQPNHDQRLQFLTREPYQGIYHPYLLTSGFIEKDEKLTIISKMIKSRIYLDGPTRYYTLVFGDKLTISISKNILKMIL